MDWGTLPILWGFFYLLHPLFIWISFLSCGVLLCSPARLQVWNGKNQSKQQPCGWILGSLACSSVSFISIPHCLFPSLTNLPLRMLHLVQDPGYSKGRGLLWRGNSQRILEVSPGASAGEGCQCSQTSTEGKIVQALSWSLRKVQLGTSLLLQEMFTFSHVKLHVKILLITLRLCGDRWCLDKPALLLCRFKGKNYPLKRNRTWILASVSGRRPDLRVIYVHFGR